MSFDTLVTNPGRLRILTALAVEESQDFVGLRKKTQLTDGNLSSHARRLREAGLVTVEKTFRNGKPVTNFTLTSQGRQALESHVRKLLAAISQRRVSTTPGSSSESVAVAEMAPVMEKVAARTMDALTVSRPAQPPMVRVSVHDSELEDDLPPEDASALRTPRVVRTVIRSVARPVMMETPAAHHPEPLNAYSLNGSHPATPSAEPAKPLVTAQSPTPQALVAPAQPDEPADWID